MSILASTRALYERKLRQLLQPDGQGQLNETEKGVLYSDSEDEEKSGEEDDAEPGMTWNAFSLYFKI